MIIKKNLLPKNRGYLKPKVGGGQVRAGILRAVAEAGRGVGGISGGGIGGGTGWTQGRGDGIRRHVGDAGAGGGVIVRVFGPGERGPRIKKTNSVKGRTKDYGQRPSRVVKFRAGGRASQRGIGMEIKKKKKKKRALHRRLGTSSGWLNSMENSSFAVGPYSRGEGKGKKKFRAGVDWVKSEPPPILHAVNS